MSETLPLRERIEQVLASKVAAIAGVLKVHRFEGEPVNPVPFEAVVEVESDSAEEGPKSRVGTTQKVMTVNVHVALNKPENANESSATVANRWAAKVEQAVLTDPELKDEDDERLVFDTRCTSQDMGPLDAGMFAVTVVFEIQYRHPRDNPYQIGA